MKKLLITAVTLIGVALALTGCSATPVTTEQPTNNAYVSEATVAFPDGASVNCLLFNAYKSGGVMCDWNNMTTGNPTTDNSLIGSIETINGRDIYCVAYDGYKEGGFDCNFDLPE